MPLPDRVGTAIVLLLLADIQALAAASPLIVMALSMPLLGEHVGHRRWLAVCVGLAGVLLIVRPGFGSLNWPVLIPLLGALQWGLFQILLRLCASSDGSGPTTLWTALVGLAALSCIVPFKWRIPDLYGWVLLAPIALLGTSANFALIKAFSLIEANALQPLGYSQLVWAALLGYLVFDDLPDRWVISGSAIIVASSLYAWHRQRLLERRPGRQAT